MDLARRGRPHDEVAERLQARRHIDRVAKRVVEDLGGRLALRDDYRARVYRHTGRELDTVGARDLCSVAAERLVESERRPDGPSRIVLVPGWRPEQRQDPIAGQLRDG